MASDTDLKLTIRAEVNDFLKGIKGATEETRSFEAELIKLREAAAAASELNLDAFKALAQQLNAGEIGTRKFAEGMKGMKSAAEEAAAAANSTSGSLTGMGHASAGVTREIMVLGREFVSGNFYRAPGSLALLASRMGILTPATFAATAAVGGLAFGLYETAASAERFDEAMASIQTSLEAIGKGGSFNPDQIRAMVSELTRLPGVSSEAAFGIVKDFTSAANISDDLRAKLVALVGDFAAGVDKDVPHAAEELAKGLDTPARFAKELDSQFHLLTASQAEALDHFERINDVTGQQSVLIEALTERFVGLRERGMTPMMQADDMLSRSLGRFQRRCPDQR